MFIRRSTTSTPTGARRHENASHDLADDGLPDLQTLWEPTTRPARTSVETLLLEAAIITPEQLAQARGIQGTTPGKSVAHILLALNAVSEEHLQAAIAKTRGLAFERLTKGSIDVAAYALLAPQYIGGRGIIPLRFEDDRLVVGIVDPNDVFLLDEVRRRTHRELKTVVTTATDISRMIEHMNAGASETHVEEKPRTSEQADSNVAVGAHDDATDLETFGDDSPVIRFVNHMILEAVKQGASDIHVEPKEKILKIRYRVDGLLFEATSPPIAMQSAITSRLKIMANLDISERRLPQDGRIRTTIHGRAVDLRLSTLPTGSGEKCVMRILDNRTIHVSLDDLGFGENALTIWKNQIEQPHGILLVTGPTGSGKTTTIYSSLRCMDANRLNISTVEDPVEYDLPSATQVQVHEKIGMTFAAALRALLRQDPDVVMVGEIRDQETASIAVQAALTGHLVLSTLHTNDAPSSITRLINVGVEPYLISSAVNAILAQRLVRKICTHCRETYVPSSEMADFLTMQGFGAEQCYRGKGCPHCRNTGYSGRLGIYELLVMDDALRDMVTRNPEVNHLRKLCRERGLVSLREDGFQKVMRGLTTVDEILRVTENA